MTKTVGKGKFIVYAIVFLWMSINYTWAVDILIDYQGFLKDAAGKPYNGTLPMSFTLYDSADGFNDKWSENHDAVEVVNGVFHVMLGNVDPIPMQALEDDRYMGLTVGNGAEMSPRRQITHVPKAVFAIEAGAVKDGGIKASMIEAGAITSTHMANGSVTADHIQSDVFADFAKKSDVLQKDEQGSVQTNTIYVKEQEPNFKGIGLNNFGQFVVKSFGVDFLANDPFSNSLVCWYTFDDDQGDKILDSVSSENDAIAIGNPSAITGQFEMAKSFDSAAKQYIQKDHAPDFDFGMDNFSLMFWFKAENQNKPAVLLSKASDWGTLDAFKGFVIGNSDFDYAGLEFYINSNGEGDNKNCVAKTPDTMNLFDNQWHMVVAVRKNNQIRLYIDGGGDNKTFTADNVVQSVTTPDPLLIGTLKTANVQDDYFFKGNIDELALWRRVLSETEISNLFNSGNGKRVTFVESNLYFVRNDGTEIAITKHISQDGLNYIINSKKTIVQSEELEVEGNIKGKSIHASENAIVDGSIGIGTSSPSVKLDVNGKIKAHEIEISGKVKSDSLEVSNANISGNAKIDGNLGIGKNPASKLDVNGKIKASQLELSGNVVATNIGSVFTRWGNGTAPSGTELLYSGFGYDSYYNHEGGGTEPLCIFQNTGGTNSSEGDRLYPLRTRNNPPGITSDRAIKCAVIYTQKPVFEMIGSSSCPSGWTSLYSGYVMGPYYNYDHPSERKCVDSSNFDASVSYNGNGMYWYGTFISTSINSNYSTNKYMKCAICTKQ